MSGEKGLMASIMYGAGLRLALRITHPLSVPALTRQAIKRLQRTAAPRACSRVRLPLIRSAVRQQKEVVFMTTI